MKYKTIYILQLLLLLLFVSCNRSTEVLDFNNLGDLYKTKGKQFLIDKFYLELKRLNTLNHDSVSIWYTDKSLVSFEEAMSREPLKIHEACSKKMRIYYLIWLIENDMFMDHWGNTAMLLNKGAIVYDIKKVNNSFAFKNIETSEIDAIYTSCFLENRKNNDTPFIFPEKYQWKAIKLPSWPELFNESLVVFKLNGTKTALSMGECYIINDNKAFPFFPDKIYNKKYLKKVIDKYYNKSPFDYTLKDSVYNLYISKQLNLKHIADYMYELGNNNFYTDQNNAIFICFNVKMWARTYKNEKKINETTIFGQTIDSKSIIILDSLFETNKITSIQLKKYGLTKIELTRSKIGFYPSATHLDVQE